MASAWIWPGRCEEEANKPHETQANSCRAIQICALSRPVLRSGRMLVCFGVASDPNYLCDFTLELPWDRELLLTLSSGECSAEIFQWKLAQVRQDLLPKLHAGGTVQRWAPYSHCTGCTVWSWAPGAWSPASEPQWFGTDDVAKCRNASRLPQKWKCCIYRGLSFKHEHRRMRADQGWHLCTHGGVHLQSVQAAMGITHNWLQHFPPLDLKVLFPTGCCCYSALQTEMLRHKGDKQRTCLRVGRGTAQEWKAGLRSPSASLSPTARCTEQKPWAFLQLNAP